MKKIPTLFKRNPNNMREVLNEPNPDCEWVFAGEGIATRKYDGTCCLIRDNKLFKRRELKKGEVPPLEFELADFDKTTGKSVGWMPVSREVKEDKWHVEAFNDGMEDGTYELLGPKVQGNPEKYEQHTLVPHNKAEQFLDVPRNFDGLREWILSKDIEGIVFHHPNGQMAKIKKRDFGMRRP